MADTREQILVATCALLEKQGYPATGLNEIVQESQTPKGSLYHYFPQGKEQIVSEAVLYAGRILVDRMRSELEKYEDPLLSLHNYVKRLAEIVEAKHFAAGNPVTIVAVEAAGSSERLRQACREVYFEMEAVLREKIACCGLSAQEASERASLMLASLEGSILLSRVKGTPEPLHRLADHITNSLGSGGLPPSQEARDFA